MDGNKLGEMVGGAFIMMGVIAATGGLLIGAAVIGLIWWLL